MTASIYALALTFAVAHAGFLGAPAAVVTPAFTRLATPAYYAYHAPFAYHAPLALAASQTAKPEAAAATAPKEPAPAAAPAATTAKPAAAPAKEAAPAEEDADYNPNPSYSFSYDVKDDETGDTKTQSESLENGVVKGSYSVVDPDGVKRTVEYTADAVNGFNAVVNMEPSDVVVKGAKMAAPPATAAAPPATAAAPAKAPSPLAFYHPFAPPLAYHAAVTKVVPAPVTKIVSPQLSYTASHIYHQPTVTYAAAPLHHKVIYA